MAGLKTMEILRRDGAYEQLKANGERLIATFRTHLKSAGIPHRIVGHPTLFDVVFIDKDVRDYRDLQTADCHRAVRFNSILRAQGIFKSPSKVYASLALTEADFVWTDAAISAAAHALAADHEAGSERRI
jgi:glutamate-1-semialdehyde 2,1-aminomutase